MEDYNCNLQTENTNLRALILDARSIISGASKALKEPGCFVEACAIFDRWLDQCSNMGIRPLSPEVCICAAIKTPSGIYRGHRHGDCFRVMQNKGIARTPEDEQGFMTSKNRFVSRRFARIMWDEAEKAESRIQWLAYASAYETYKRAIQIVEEECEKEGK